MQFRIFSLLLKDRHLNGKPVIRTAGFPVGVAMGRLIAWEHRPVVRIFSCNPQDALQVGCFRPQMIAVCSAKLIKLSLVTLVSTSFKSSIFPAVWEKLSRRLFIVLVVTICFGIAVVMSIVVHCLLKAQLFLPYMLMIMMAFWVIQLLFAATGWSSLFSQVGLSMKQFPSVLSLLVFFTPKVKKIVSWLSQKSLPSLLWPLHFQP